MEKTKFKDDETLSNKNKNNSNSNEIIHLFFHPKSVAIFGASTNKLKGGYRILENLISNNYKGKIFPINPNGGEALGIKFYKSIDEIEEEIDLAIIFVPNRIIPTIIKECIKKGVKGAIIQAAGFEEVGDIGLKLRDELMKITSNFTKIRIVGPNCTGVTRIDSENEGFFSPFIRQYGYRPGNIGIISQSGMLNGGYFKYLNTNFKDMNVKYVASIGNKMDLGENEFLEYYLQDRDIKVIVLYLESFKDARKFIKLCRNARQEYNEKNKNKSIILLKGGVTEQGQLATASHTGALAENPALVEGLIKQARVIKATSFYEMFLYARVHSMLHSSNIIFPKTNKVAFITVTGGGGTVFADLTIKYGLELPDLSKEIYQKLEEIYPSWMPPNKKALVDLWPAIENAKGDSNAIHKIALEILLSDPKIGGLMMATFTSPDFPFDHNMLIEIRNKFQKPIFCWSFGVAEGLRELNEKLNQEKIPTFFNLEDMIKCYKTIVNI
ncbi:MAG: CoA-binding protein [Promethearchaeota archaeon]